MRALSLAAILALSFLTTLPAFAQTTFVVTKTADTNDGTCDADCSLREAIEAAEAAAGDDLIRFAPALDGQSIFPTSEYIINTNVEIDAVTGLSEGITIDAGLQFFAVFQVFPLSGPPNTVSLAGLTLSRSQNGALFNQGIVTVDQCTIRDNTAGAIENEGTLVVKNSTLSGNAASTIDRSTLFNLSGDVTVLNSTFSGNTTSSISVAAAIQTNSSGTVTVRNSTFSGNTHTLGQISGISGGIVTIGNTVFDSGSGANLGLGTIISEGFNICDDACGLTGTSDQTSADLQLGPLADNGGPTLTHTLLTGSPAIDIGGTCGPEDQRGESAPVAGTFGGSATCDAGAVEIATPPPPFTLVVNTLDGGDDGTCGTDGADPIQDCSLPEAVALANSNPDANAITFSVDGTIVVSAIAEITTPVTVDGASAPGGAHAVQINSSTLPFGSGDAIRVVGVGASNSEIAGLVVGPSSENGIAVLEGAAGVRIVNNYIGTNPAGADLGTAFHGIVINASPDAVIGGTSAGEGNVIGFNPDSGILLVSATNALIQGNHIGTNPAGDDLGNEDQGIFVAESSGTTIGGSDAGASNVVGFSTNGIELTGGLTSLNSVLGNFVGTNASGANLGNTQHGILVQQTASDNTIGGATTGAANTIGFNGFNGIRIIGSGTTGNTVLGNYIGTNAGSANLGNGDQGVYIISGAADNTVGGANAGEGNTIGFNGREGVLLAFAGTSGNKVLGNYIGTNANGDDLGNDQGVEVSVGASGNTVGGAKAGEGNTIGFNEQGGVVLKDAGTSGNEVLGNYIGTNANGDNIGNPQNGILIENRASGNTIGGATMGAANTVGFNGGSGIVLTNASTSSNTVLGNFVGTDASGANLGNTLRGILIAGGATNNTIGGANAGEGNTVGFNALNGIRLEGSGTSGNVVRGNLVGTDASGADLGNTGKGISVASGASNNTIGGTGAGDGNTVGFSSQDGIEVAGNGTSGNTVQGNFVGTNAAGDDLGNTNFGVTLIFGASNNTVGGAAEGAENTIGFHGLAGVYLNDTSTGNTVLGNFVGTNAAGDDLGNDGNGVQLFNAPNNTIGGTGADDGNTIANNGVGINVEGEPAVGNALLGNLLFDNSGLGIDLLPFGIAANDGCTDADVGPNGLQNFPVLAQALADGGTTTIDYDLDTAAGTYRVEFFSVATPDPTGNGEGRTFLGAQDVTVSAGCGETFQFVLPTQLGTDVSVTATATSMTSGVTTPTFGGTSEFSTAVAVAVPLRSITGEVFSDDGNGIIDAATDVPFEGITVFLDTNDNDVLDTDEQRDTTDAQGGFGIAGLPPGAYTVKIDTAAVAEGLVIVGGNDPQTVNLDGSVDPFVSFLLQLECGPGFFLDPDDPTNCLPAPPGTFVASAGATEAEPCVPGTFQPLEGQTSCDPAPAGSFVTIERATEAEVCPLGKYQPLEGQTSCLPADPGNFVPVEEAIVQSPCELGTFQPEAGQAMCLPAPVGSYVDVEEATSATSCPVGTTTDGEGATSASDCVAIPAQTFVVTKTDDTNDGTCDADCSLREAIAAADANLVADADTIRFSADVQGGIIAMSSTFGQFVLATDVVIDGATVPSASRQSRAALRGGTTDAASAASSTATGAGVTIDAGSQGFRIFLVEDVFPTPVNVTLRRLTLINGDLNDLGGAIFNRGNLALSECTLRDNTALFGGAIFNGNTTTLTVDASTLTFNQVNGDGGAISSGSSQITVTNSTITGNTAGSSGGGVRISDSGSSLVVRNSTFKDNAAPQGSGIVATGGASLTIGNTILNNGAGNVNVTVSPPTSEGFNVCDDACGLTGTGDLTETDPLLDVLADNGGPTLTHALLPGSPAIDIGGTCGPTDQRSFDAPIIGLATNSTALCDAGSFETEILDAEPPTVVIATTLDDPTATQPIPLTFTFSEVVSGFSADDIVVTGGTLGAVSTADSTTFAADLTPDSSGEITVDIGAGVATDLAGNPNEAAETFSITFDNDGPAGYTVAFDQPAVNAANETAVSFTISDAEVGATFAYTITSDGGAGEVTGSGTIGSAAPRLPGGDLTDHRGNKGGGFMLTFMSTLTSEQVTDIDVSGLPDGTLTLSVTLTDPLGNEGDEATDTVIKDTVAPTVTVATTASDPTSTQPIPVTFAFSEEVSGFDASDITVTGGALQGFAADGATGFTAEVDPDGSGAVTVAVAAGVADDLAGNPNVVSNTLAITFDGDAPTVIVSTSASDPTNTEPIPVTFTFSEGVTGFQAADVTVTGGTLGALVTSDNTTFSGAVDPDGSGEVSVAVPADVATDAAGNGNADSNTLTIEFDGDAPVLTITTTTPEPTVQSPFSVTLTFSEPVTGFDALDVDVTNGTLSEFAGAGDTYTALVTPTDFGVVTVSVDADLATDTAGNGNTADTLTRTFEERFDLALTTEFVFTGPGTGTLTANVTNTGSVPATRVRVKITKTFDVATGPKQLLIGALAPGETGTAVFDFGSAGADAEVRLKVDDLVVRRGEPDRTNNDAVVFLVPGDGGADTVAPEITGALSGQLFAGTVEENRIDDTGVASVVLDPGAVNLTLAVDPFTAGDVVVSYTAAPIDPMQDATGTIRATDLAGNATTLPVSIPRTPPPPPTETLVVRLTPDNAPVFIGNGGGSFTFTGEVTNPTSGRLAQDVWLVLVSPSGAEEVQFGPFRVRVDAGGMTAEEFTVTVDRDAEAGVYTYEGRVGDFPGTVTDVDAFTFEKLGAQAQASDPLAARGNGAAAGATASNPSARTGTPMLPMLSTTAGLPWGITDDAEWAALLDEDMPSTREPGTASDDFADGRTDADEQAAPHEPAEDGAFDAEDQQGEAAPADGERSARAPEPASDEQTASQPADRNQAERTQPDEDTLDTVSGTADDTQVTRDANKQGSQRATAKDGPLASTNGAPVARSQALPADYALAAPYPNPLTQAHTATIRLALPEASDVAVVVYDLRGRIVTALASGTYEAGHHAFAFDTRLLASGTYVVRVVAGPFADTHKVTVVR